MWVFQVLYHCDRQHFLWKTIALYPCFLYCSCMRVSRSSSASSFKPLHFTHVFSIVVICECLGQVQPVVLNYYILPMFLYCSCMRVSRSSSASSFNSMEEHHNTQDDSDTGMVSIQHNYCIQHTKIMSQPFKSLVHIGGSRGRRQREPPSPHGTQFLHFHTHCLKKAAVLEVGTLPKGKSWIRLWTPLLSHNFECWPGQTGAMVSFLPQRWETPSLMPNPSNRRWLWGSLCASDKRAQAMINPPWL